MVNIDGQGAIFLGRLNIIPLVVRKVMYVLLYEGVVYGMYVRPNV
jgi:hypothetical protein